MKNKRALFGFLFLIGGILWVLVDKKQVTQTNTPETAAVVASTEKASSHERTSEAKALSASADSSIAQEFQKCFHAQEKIESLEDLKIFFEKQTTFSNPAIDIERYSLVDSENKKMVVEHIPSEEFKNQVRVFKINPVDQMPDRVWDFAHSNSENKDVRLSGALSVGKVVEKSETTRQLGANNELLLLESSNSKITKLTFSQQGMEFFCQTANDCKCVN